MFSASVRAFFRSPCVRPEPLGHDAQVALQTLVCCVDLRFMLLQLSNLRREVLLNTLNFAIERLLYFLGLG